MYSRNNEMLQMGLEEKLIYAVATNDLASIENKLRGISKKQLDIKYSSFDNPLLLAANDNNIAAAKLLLKAGASTEIKDDATGSTALAIALSKGHEEFAYLLIDHGANICHESNRRISILHYAASKCGKRMIEFLLDKGLDINYLASNNLSILDFTTDIHTKGNFEAAQTLVANGISKDIITKSFKEACWRGNDKIARMLLEAGADINVILGKNGTKPEILFWLCKKPTGLQRTRYLKTIRLLIEQGINFEVSYKFAGHLLNCIGSPLEQAKEERFFDAVNLIKQGQW